MNVHGLFSTDLWRKISTLASASHERRGAVAFVTSDDKVQFGAGDTLIVDASNEAIAQGRTAASVLRSAHDRGARLFSLGSLHAKIFCFDGHVVVGSANASTNSVEALVEAAVVSDDLSLVAETRTFLFQLETVATRIDDAFLDRIEKIRVTGSPNVQPLVARPPDALVLQIGFFIQTGGKQHVLVVPSDYAELVRRLFRTIGGGETKRTNVRVSWLEGSFTARTLSYYRTNNEWKLTVSTKDAPDLFAFAGRNVGPRFKASLAANPTGVGDSLRLDLSVGPHIQSSVTLIRG